MQHSTFQMIYRQVKHIFVQEKKIEGKIKSHIYLRSHHILHRILTQLLFLDKQYPSWKYKDLKIGVPMLIMDLQDQRTLMQ